MAQALTSQTSRDDYESSSEEEELNDADIMVQTLRSYHGTGAGGQSLTTKLLRFPQDIRYLHIKGKIHNNSPLNLEVISWHMSIVLRLQHLLYSIIVI